MLRYGTTDHRFGLGRVLIEGQNTTKVEGSAMDEWAPLVAAAPGSDGFPMIGVRESIP